MDFFGFATHIANYFTVDRLIESYGVGVCSSIISHSCFPVSCTRSFRINISTFCYLSLHFSFCNTLLRRYHISFYTYFLHPLDWLSTTGNLFRTYHSEICAVTPLAPIPSSLRHAIFRKQSLQWVAVSELSHHGFPVYSGRGLPSCSDISGLQSMPSPIFYWSTTHWCCLYTLTVAGNINFWRYYNSGFSAGYCVTVE